MTTSLSLPGAATLSDGSAQADEAAVRASLPLLDLYRPFGRIYPIQADKRPLDGCLPSQQAADPNDYFTLANWLRCPDRTGWALLPDSPLLAVIDRENPNKKETPGPDGIAAFDQLCASLQLALPAHLTIQSGSGGIHDAFCFPPDLIPEGQYVPFAQFLDGVELLSFGHAVILPGSRVATRHGLGEYRVMAGEEAGIVEMPSPLAQWIVEKIGFRDLRDLGRSSHSKRTTGRSESPRFDAKSRNAAAHTDPGEINDPELTAAIGRMSQRNPHFLRVWNNEPPDAKKDGSRSGRLFCLAKICLGFGYQEAFAIQLARHWCHRHDKSFDPKQWVSIFRGASESYAEDQKERHAKRS